MGLTFTAATHEYRLDGHVLPSITQVLDATGILRPDPRIPPHRLEFARERGKAVHLALQFVNEGRLDPQSLAALIEPYLFGFEAWAANHAGDFTPTLVEPPMADAALRFAGTPDLIGERKGRLGIVEVKTGSDVPPGVVVQTAAQKLLAKANGHAIVERWELHLRPDGSYRFHEHRDVGDEAEFRSALFLYQRRWAREGRPPHLSEARCVSP